ncbi:MAG: hypothetical protein KBF88_05540 [Polyangiaceae bacterium]|nr:hypothetical protein [Polyangiaceae bacterium]
MTTAKVAVSIPQETLLRAKHLVRSGRASSLSAFVTTAVAEKLERDGLSEILDEMDRLHGKPGKEAVAWAKRILRK